MHCLHTQFKQLAEPKTRTQSKQMLLLRRSVDNFKYSQTNRGYSTHFFELYHRLITNCVIEPDRLILSLVAAAKETPPFVFEEGSDLHQRTSNRMS